MGSRDIFVSILIVIVPKLIGLLLAIFVRLIMFFTEQPVKDWNLPQDETFNFFG